MLVLVSVGCAPRAKSGPVFAHRQAAAPAAEVSPSGLALAKVPPAPQPGDSPGRLLADFPGELARNSRRPAPKRKRELAQGREFSVCRPWRYSSLPSASRVFSAMNRIEGGCRRTRKESGRCRENCTHRTAKDGQTPKGD